MIDRVFGVKQIGLVSDTRTPETARCIRARDKKLIEILRNRRPSLLWPTMVNIHAIVIFIWSLLASMFVFMFLMRAPSKPVLAGPQAPRLHLVGVSFGFT